MRENDNETYQNIKITNYARTVDSLTRNAIRYLELIIDCFQNRFKISTGLTLDTSLILNLQVWLARSQDTTYEGMFSKTITSNRKCCWENSSSLERANFLSDVAEYKNEYIKFLKHAITFTNP